MFGKVQSKAVRIWLFFGLLMVFIQVFLGGVTRLTGSGLSITKWDIVTGVVIPFTENAWLEVFELYKKTPQYQKINQGITIEDFKYIFWWEYLHRLWARLMGFVFIVPFLLFWRRKLLDSWLIKDLLIVLLLAAFVASLGWIMVASGLINRPWVNAYKLSFHLCAALLLIGYLLWTTLKAVYGMDDKFDNRNNYWFYLSLPVFFFLQVFLGGLMSGMKAALVAPTWPDINGSMIPSEVLAIKDYISFMFNDYESNHGSAFIVQFLHRSLAYIILFIIFSLLVLQKVKYGVIDSKIMVLFVVTTMQGVLGVLTLIYSIGSLPIEFAVSHQMLGIVCFGLSVFCLYNKRYLG